MKSPSEPRIARIFGIDIRVHWTFLILLWFLLFDGLRLGPGGLKDSAVWLGLLFGSVLVHELAHAVVGRSRGAAVRDIILLPIGGATRTERFPDRPRDEFLMTVVGPATSFALAGLGALLAFVAGQRLLPIDLHHGSLWAQIFWLNVLLGSFNLLPAFPMDGGRILRAGLSVRLGRVRATRAAATVGRVLAVGLGIFGLYANVWLLFIAVFIYLAASGEAQQTEVDASLAGHRVADATIQVPLVPASSSAGEAAAEAVAAGREVVVVIGPRGDLGIASLPELLAARERAAGSIAHFHLPQLSPDSSLEDAVHTVRSTQTAALPVVFHNGTVGAVTQRSVAQLAALLISTSGRRPGS